MKLSLFFFGASLAANLALSIFLVAGIVRPTDSTPTENRIATQTLAPTSPAPNAATSSATWTALQPDDLPAMLARLRAEGFPPAMIRALMAEQIRLQFAGRRAALERSGGERRFWEPVTYDAKTTDALRQLAKDEAAALKDLLGPEASTDETALALLRRQFPNWSPGTIEAVQRLQREFEDRNREIFADNENSLADAFTSFADNRARRKALEEAQRAELMKLLTPAELEDYDLRNHNTANNLRSRLASFNPTEQEFRSLFQLQRAFDDRYQPGPAFDAVVDPEQRRKLASERGQAQRQLTEQIRSALGEERFADYQRSTDNNYDQTYRLIARLELPPETTSQVYAVQQDVQQRARTIQGDRNLPVEDRNAQLAALAAEAETKITATLGPRGFDAYKRYGGIWMRQLQPRPFGGPGGGGGRGGGGR